jgi:bacterioferritin (cytochrome b1)
MSRPSKNTNESAVLVDRLTQILKIEYWFTVSYPRLARSIRDINTKVLAHSLGTASVRHADIVADAFNGLGGNPVSCFVNLPESPDLVEIFTQQLNKEILVLSLHQQCAKSLKDENLRDKFSVMASEEKAHIETVEKIINNLKRGADRQELGSLGPTGTK